MIVASDNSPLQYLILIGCVECLPAMYGRVITTPQVIEELRREGTPEPVRWWALQPPAWLTVESPTHIEFLEELDLGEASAISLAKERRASLVLIDERAGTETAKRVGIATTGTLGILIDAGARGMVDFDSAIHQLTTATPFYASRKLIDTARRLFSERRAGGR